MASLNWTEAPNKETVSLFNSLLIPSLSFPATGMPMIDRFHSDTNVFVFLISTLAGGTGLNLTGKSLQLQPSPC